MAPWFVGVAGGSEDLVHGDGLEAAVVAAGRLAVAVGVHTAPQTTVEREAQGEGRRLKSRG